ncbi:MAG: hypothetical protein QNJ72_40740 [Pleurocapsa sp. MO_226.B13]|nr:hypothetical protein [Pleurocapsa sp. MO_226.B13]
MGFTSLTQSFPDTLMMSKHQRSLRSPIFSKGLHLFQQLNCS